MAVTISLTIFISIGTALIGYSLGVIQESYKCDANVKATIKAYLEENGYEIEE